MRYYRRFLESIQDEKTLKKCFMFYTKKIRNILWDMYENADCDYQGVFDATYGGCFEPWEYEPGEEVNEKEPDIDMCYDMYLDLIERRDYDNVRIIYYGRGITKSLEDIVENCRCIKNIIYNPSGVQFSIPLVPSEDQMEEILVLFRKLRTYFKSRSRSR